MTHAQKSLLIKFYLKIFILLYLAKAKKTKMGEEPDAFWLGESWTKFIGHNVCRLQGGYHNDQLRKWQSCGRKITTDSFMYPVFIRYYLSDGYEPWLL